MADNPRRFHFRLWEGSYRRRLARYTADAVQKILADPLEVPGVGSVHLPQYIGPLGRSFDQIDYGVSRDVLAAIEALESTDGEPEFPVILPKANDRNSVVYVRSRMQWRALVTAWSRRKLLIHNRAELFRAEMHRALDRFGGIAEFTDDDGEVLSDDAAFAIRSELDIELRETLTPERIEARLRTTEHDPSPMLLDENLEVAKAQLIDHLGNAVREAMEWVTEGGPVPANAEQATAERLIAGHRQEGRSAIRRSKTVTEAGGAYSIWKNRVEAVAVEGTPNFRDGSGGMLALRSGTLRSGARVLPLSCDGSLTWSQSLRAVNHPGSAADGVVEIEVEDDAGGWRVTIGHRAAPNEHEATIQVQQPFGPAPREGWHHVVLTARNKVGPKRLTLEINMADLTPVFAPTLYPTQGLTVGAAASFTMGTATGGNGALTYTLTPELPAGLSFDAETRVVSGTPTEGSPPTLYTLTAKDEDGDTATQTMTLSVAVPSE